MACLLYARGKGLALDEFQKATSLAISRLSRGTESRRRPAPPCVSIEVSAREFADFEGQIRDAITFLSENRAGIKELVAFAGVEEAWLEFGIRLREDVAVQADYLPVGLCSLLGDLKLGVVVSHYPVR